MRGGVLRLAKTTAPLRFVWTWPGIGVASLDPTSVTVSRDPAGRWFVVLHADVPSPEPLPATGQAAGVDAGLKDFAVLSTGETIPHPRHRNRSLARAISCTGWGGFRALLESKAERYGRTVVAVDRWYPSSKTCSACEHLLASLSPGTRHWTCAACGTRHDRDVNAAKNMLAAGLAAGAGNGADACGGGARRAAATWARSPVKQEPPGVSPGIPVH